MKNWIDILNMLKYEETREVYNVHDEAERNKTIKKLLSTLKELIPEMFESGRKKYVFKDTTDFKVKKYVGWAGELEESCPDDKKVLTFISSLYNIGMFDIIVENTNTHNEDKIIYQSGHNQYIFEIIE